MKTIAKFILFIIIFFSLRILYDYVPENYQWLVALWTGMIYMGVVNKLFDFKFNLK